MAAPYVVPLPRFPRLVTVYEGTTAAPPVPVFVAPKAGAARETSNPTTMEADSTMPHLGVVGDDLLPTGRARRPVTGDIAAPPRVKGRARSNRTPHSRSVYGSTSR